MATDLEESQQRQIAGALFNRTWTLIEKPRTSEEDREMLATAFASRLHWQGIGSDENLAVGDWLIAHVASRLGYADLALDFAAAAHERTVRAGLADWVLASSLEGLARAHAVAGHEDERDDYVARARQALESVDDVEDRELIESQIATVPGI
jgi:hypothetical protein